MSAPEGKSCGKHCKWMGWVALVAGVLYPGLFVLTDNAQLATIAWPYFVFCGATVGACMGYATWEHVRITGK